MHSSNRQPPIFRNVRQTNLQSYSGQGTSQKRSHSKSIAQKTTPKNRSPEVRYCRVLSRTIAYVSIKAVLVRFACAQAEYREHLAKIYAARGLRRHLAIRSLLQRMQRLPILFRMWIQCQILRTDLTIVWEITSAPILVISSLKHGASPHPHPSQPNHCAATQPWMWGQADDCLPPPDAR